MSDLPPSPTVNKAEMAALLSVSVVTLNAWIAKKGERFPVVERGARGVEWRFDPAAVIAFIQGERDAAARAGAARDEQLDQFKLPGVETESPGLSIADRVKLAQLRKLETDEAIRNSFLLDKVSTRQVLTDALTSLRRDVEAAIRQTLADHHIPETTTRSIFARIEEAQRQCVERLRVMLKDGAPDAESQPALL